MINILYLFQASIHLKNHSDEVEQKIVSVLDAMISQQLSTWQPSNQLPSKIFKDLCRQLSKVHESVADVWSQETTTKIMTKVCDFYVYCFNFCINFGPFLGSIS